MLTHVHVCEKAVLRMSILRPNIVTILIFAKTNYYSHKDDGYIMSRVVRKPAFCICENKDADQLRDNREADQRLCFRDTDYTIPLLPKSEISSL